jgi:HAD superfamily hydrolase (TIGR01509 family)
VEEKMIKLVISDFDGVLLDLKDVHFEALNKALAILDKKYVISLEDHIKTFDGLSTKRKLTLLNKTKQFPLDKIEFVNHLKQKFTFELLENFKNINLNIKPTVERLKKEGILFYVASNAIRETVIRGLKKLDILDLVDHIYSNEDAKNQKPHPEIYMKAIIDSGLLPNEILIIEDSKHGREAAYFSGCNVCGIDNSFNFNYENFDLNMNKKQIKWEAINDTIVLIPMSGLGSRFAKDPNYTKPKPLIDVNGIPMIKKVVDNLAINAHFVFIVQEKHYKEYNLDIILPLLADKVSIIQVNGVTKGAACSTLLAKELINNDKHLLIANSDQFIEWDSSEFLYNSISQNLDGNILTFECEDKSTKWSYAKINNLGYVEEVREKQPISTKATVGVYWFNKGSEYVKYAEQMIEKDIRYNNEFYVAPVYNEFVQANKKIKTYNCKKMWGLGTPEDLELFIKNEQRAR